MKRIKESLKDQGVLFSNSYIGDRLPEDDEVYLFDKLIDKLDISAITRNYSNEGGSMFSPRDQLAIILYAFHKGITSSVKIAELVLKSLPFIYLSGGHIIKRRTICDFRIKHREAIKKIFISTIDIAIKSGLVNKNDIFAIDGSKFEANAGFSKTRSKKEWKERQKKIVDHVEKFLEDWEAQDRLEEDFENERREEFERIKKKLNEIKDGSIKRDIELEDKNNTSDSSLDNGDKTKFSKEVESSKKRGSLFYKKNKMRVNNTKDAAKFLREYENIDSLLHEYVSSDDDMLLNLGDFDCRIMKSDGTTKECYNVQTISNNQVIVAVDVTRDENDQHQLQPMVQELINNNVKLNANDKIKLAGDAGYNMGENLAYIDQHNNLDGYISMLDRSEKNNLEKNEYHKENFEYNKDDNSLTCPEGKKLLFIKKYKRDNKNYTLYGCDLKECVFCSKRDACLNTKDNIRRGYRTIEDDGFLFYRKQMRIKMQQEESKKTYSKRFGSIEPVFGQIKNNRGFRRFRLKGLRKVQLEFMIMAIAFNLGKIMKYINGDSKMMGANV